MHIISAAELELYYKAIVNYAFLQFYNKKYTVDYYDQKNNRLHAYDNDIKRNIDVYVQSGPEIEDSNIPDYEYVVYYSSTKYSQKATKERYGNNVRCLTKECYESITKLFYVFLTDSASFFDNMDSHFKEVLFAELLNRDALSYLPPKLYKYLSKNALEDKSEMMRRKTMDGMVTLVSPCTFNDPFDIDCEISNTNMQNLFRVFCVSPKYDDILMWSYYGNDHKGYCIEYDASQIVDAIKNINIPGILIIGKIKYENNRPSKKLASKNINITFIRDYIRVSMTKYKKWEHEDEYRFVLISNNFPVSNNYFPQVSVGIPDKIFAGCKNSNRVLYDNKNNSYTPIGLDKDPKDYKLIVKANEKD